jgi:hypothetical protein
MAGLQLGSVGVEVDEPVYRPSAAMSLNRFQELDVLQKGCPRAFRKKGRHPRIVQSEIPCIAV